MLRIPHCLEQGWPTRGPRDSSHFYKIYLFYNGQSSEMDEWIPFFYFIYIYIFFIFNFSLQCTLISLLYYLCLHVKIIVNTIIITHYVSIFHSKKCLISNMGYIILYVARGVMMHFQSGPQDHLGWPPLV
jgi:hypothetical protein